MRAPLAVASARMRRRPRRWAAPGLTIALVAAFAGAVAVESVIVADHAARNVLNADSATDRTIRLTWPGTLTAEVVEQAHRFLAQPFLGPTTVVLALNPVRLGRAVVRPVGIRPLSRWASANPGARIAPCRPRNCPMLVAGGGRVPSILTTFGARITIVGQARLDSAVPLGYVPAFQDQGPVLVTDDLAGLDSLSGLSGIMRTHNWVAPLRVAALHAWTLASVEARLQRAQAGLASTASPFQLTAPFENLDLARSEASAAPRRLLLVGGGVLVTLLLFIALAAVGLRQEQLAEIERLRSAGARPTHAVVFVTLEAAWISGLGVASGYVLAVLVGGAMASNAGEPAAMLLSHSLLTVGGLSVALAGWIIATGLIAASTLVRNGRVLDLLAVTATTVLVAGLLIGSGSAHTWTGLLVPLCCLSAGLVLFRIAAMLLRGGEALTRRASVNLRLALVSLARAGDPAAAAIAFTAVSTALAGFAVSFHATLVRGAVDQAAAQVPLDALVAPGPSFIHPLGLLSLSGWRELSHGRVFPVRRTDASFVGGPASVTVPMLGIPAPGLSLIDGWRTADGSAPLPILARRLRPAGTFRSPGPRLPAPARWLRLTVSSPRLDLTVSAALRDAGGSIRHLLLGTAGPGRASVQAKLPWGRWELEAIQFDESTGLAITNGHQNGESRAPETQFAARFSVGPLLASDARRHVVLRQDLASWRAVGAASTTPARSAAAASVSFQTNGLAGVLRPEQPSDHRALPVLADPATAAAAGPGRRIGLTVDDVPVQARLVGVIKRFPTVAPSAAGFIVADERALADALDAELPGQGRSDELWISTSRLRRLRVALEHGPLAQLDASFRASRERTLRDQPLAGGVTGTLLAAGVMTAALAVLGLLLVLAGPLRDERVEHDLESQGLGPLALRRELRVRFAVAANLGIWSGLLIAVLIDRLAVAAVGAVESGTAEPPLVTVVPWLELASLGMTITAACLFLGWAMTVRSFPNRPGRPPTPRVIPPRGHEPVEEAVR